MKRLRKPRERVTIPLTTSAPVRNKAHSIRATQKPRVDAGVQESPDDKHRKSDQTIHVLLKLRSEMGQTVSAHQQMIAKHGSALLGKMGKGLGSDFREALNAQIGNGVKTFLFLTTRQGWNGPYVTYRSLLSRVYQQLPSTKLKLVPAYYSWDTASVTTWFEISSMEQLTREEMNRITVVSSGRSQRS